MFLNNKVIQILIPFILLLTGCFGVVKVPIYPLGKNPQIIKSIRDKYTGENPSFDSLLISCKLKENPGEVSDCLKLERNKIISELLLIVDYDYQNYEGSLIAGRAVSNLGFGLATTTLSLASAVSTVESSKTIISSLASLVSSTRTEVDKNLYFEQTAQALVLKMRALKKETRLPIVQGFEFEYVDYNVEQAISDILNYYRAGTLANAVQGLYEDIGQDDTLADKNLKAFNKKITDKKLKKYEILSP